MSNYTISLQDGIDWTTNWRDNHSGLVKAFKIDKDEIDEIFQDYPNAEGIRGYLGEDDNGNPKLVMVAVDSNGDDILTTVYDHASPCPNDCDTGSVLNNGN